MDEMAISKFKATCLAALDRVRRTGRPLRVTRFGKPVADIMPPSPETTGVNWLGAMRGTLDLRDDLIAPAAEPKEWEALR
jgi:antitoxin (DNA-binding transcriptional repressor) of toxin-antitoxin stability system